MSHDQSLRRAFTDEMTVVAWSKRGGRYKHRPVMGWPFRTAKSGRRLTRTDMLRAQRVAKYGVDPWYESLW